MKSGDLTMKCEDIILGAYFRADGPMTLEQLYATYPRIDATRLTSAGASLERRGFIEAVSGGGHAITEAGHRRWAEDY